MKTIFERLLFLQATYKAGLGSWNGIEFAKKLYEKTKPKPKLKIYVVYWKLDSVDSIVCALGNNINDVASELTTSNIPVDLNEEDLLSHMQTLGYSTFKALCVDEAIQQFFS